MRRWAMGGLGASSAHQGTDVPSYGDNLGSTETPHGAAPRHSHNPNEGTIGLSHPFLARACIRNAPTVTHSRHTLMQPPNTMCDTPSVKI